jgi:hypothetical protein
MDEPPVPSALMRVLGTPQGVTLRPDTPLAGIGVDPLARLLLVDACLDDGIAVDPDRVWRAQTLGEVMMAADATHSS